MSPNTDFSAVLSDQRLSLIQIKQPQTIQNKLSTIKDDIEDTSQSVADECGDTLERAPDHNRCQR